MAIGLFVVIPFLLAMVWLVVRLWSGPRVSTECCAKCRYSVMGLPGDTCPECGSNLSIVGTLKPDDVQPISSVGWMVWWSVVWPLPALIGASIVIALIPQGYSSSGTVTLSRPMSGAYRSVVITVPADGSTTRDQSENDALFTLTWVDGSIAQLHVTADGIVDWFEDASGSKRATEMTLGSEAIGQWMSALGLDPNDPLLAGEATRMVSSLQGKLGADVKENTRQSSLHVNAPMIGGFSSNMSSWTGSQIPKARIGAYLFAGAVVLWLAGIASILYFKRERSTQATS